MLLLGRFLTTKTCCRHSALTLDAGCARCEFLRMEGSQQQHANKHTNCGCQRKNTVRIT